MGHLKKFIETHATTSVSTTNIVFYHDKAMVNRKGITKERVKIDDRNHFFSLKLIREANLCNPILVVAKTVTFDHGETQPYGGIVPRFIDPRLLYMVLSLYPDSRGMYKKVKEL